MRWRVTLAGLGFLAAAAFLVGLGLDLPALRFLTKPLPVLCLAAAVAAQRRDPLARAVTVGLCLSAVGDALLEGGLFLPGLLAFLGAHVAYATGFFLDTPRLAILRALPFAGWGASIYALLLPNLGALAVPVLLYVLAICVVMWRAAVRIGARGSPRADEWIGLLGALAFAASDSLIALDRFHAPLPAAPIPIILLYWAGQCGFAGAAGATSWGMLRGARGGTEAHESRD
ncbi:MAG TPA: lysoplasmalogenase [Vicinamibacteria bacterium]|jgi:alkenylglycerophosphocholine/alkenylglycerophosphoethanolamine hydrolase|nr:lysoplasmalogenase [Vicinamibacteria bacterium]